MSGAILKRVEDGVTELNRLVDIRQGAININYEKFKGSKNIAVSAFANSLQSEVESLKIAIMHRKNAVKWFKEVLKQLEDQKREA